MACQSSGSATAVTDSQTRPTAPHIASESTESCFRWPSDWSLCVTRPTVLMPRQRPIPLTDSQGVTREHHQHVGVVHVSRASRPPPRAAHCVALSPSRSQEYKATFPVRQGGVPSIARQRSQSCKATFPVNASRQWIGNKPILTPWLRVVVVVNLLANWGSWPDKRKA